MIESHPNDPKAKITVMNISKHRSESMLSHYIGEADKEKNNTLMIWVLILKSML
ncbi:MAG: hypothetical protein K1W37_00280 [Lachnospiraceae bacterium]